MLQRGEDKLFGAISAVIIRCSALIVPTQAPAAGSGAVRKGEKLTLVVTASPLPGPTPDGPSLAPHQLSVALTTPLAPSTRIPKDALPSMLLLCASAPVLPKKTLMPTPRIEPALTVSRTMLESITTPVLPRSEMPRLPPMRVLLRICALFEASATRT